MSAPDRDAILDDEYLRQTPGLRPFSVGILRLCRQLGYFVPPKPGEEKALGREDVARQNLVVAWLLDETNPLEEVRGIAQLFQNDPAQFACIMDDYEFQISPALLVRAKAEVDRAQHALTLAAYTIEPKPGSSQGPSPQGK
jgi:hypothetical protein